MDLSAKALGKGVVDSLRTKISQPILIVGNDRFTRGDLSRLECFNFTAAATLNKAIADLQFKNLKDLFANCPPSALALPRVGAIAFAVIGSAMQVKGIGGEHPLEAWIAKHAEKGEDGITTFHTIKKRLRKEAAAEKKLVKDRKRARKTRAHELRVKRYLDKQTAADVSPERTS